MIQSQEIHKGVVLKIENQLYLVTEFQYVNPGKGGGFTRAKLKNLATGQVVEKTFRSGDKLEDVQIDTRKMQFLYAHDGQYTVMDNENYEQYTLTEDQVGDAKYYLKENMQVELELYEGRPITFLVPNHVELKIAQTDPGFKGDTVQGAMKPAIMETGLKVQVPLFVNQGETIRVDTRDASYIERVSK